MIVTLGKPTKKKGSSSLLCSSHLGNPLPLLSFNTNQYLFDYSMKDIKQIKESTFSLQTEST